MTSRDALVKRLQRSIDNHAMTVELLRDIISVALSHMDNYEMQQFVEEVEQWLKK